MVKVKLILKTLDKNYNESKKEIIDSKEFPKGKKYEQFISDITKSFKIKNKKDITLMVFTTDGDENPIYDQEDFDNFEALEYRVIIEKDEIPSFPDNKPKVGKKNKKNDESKNKEENKKNNINENDSEKEEDEINEDHDDEININLKINMEISEKELEKFIDEQIKIFPEIENQNINDDIQFDIKKYKEKLENKNINIIKNFNNSLNSKINDIIINKSNFMKETINNSVLKFSKTHIEQIKKINNETQGIKEDFSEIISNSNEMNKSLEILKEGIETRKIINPNHEIKPTHPEVNEVKPQNEIINQNPKIKPQNNRKNLNNIDDDEDDIPINLNKLTIKFVNENINLEINKKTANFLEIQNIKIENIGTETYKILFFEKDENNSSKDIYFNENSSNLNKHKLSLNGDFEPSGKESHTIIL